MSRSAKAQAHHPSGSRVHGAGVLRPAQHDPYRPKGRLPQGTTCPACHAQVLKGRWQWVTGSAPAALPATAKTPAPQRCPACTRVALHDPAGELQLSGAYVGHHAAELRALIQHEAERETAEHPMERLMDVAAQPDGSLHITTTGTHLIRVLGHALERAHQGRLALDYLDGQTMARARWVRDA